MIRRYIFWMWIVAILATALGQIISPEKLSAVTTAPDVTITPVLSISSARSLAMGKQFIFISSTTTTLWGLDIRKCEENKWNCTAFQVASVGSAIGVAFFENTLYATTVDNVYAFENIENGTFPRPLPLPLLSPGTLPTLAAHGGRYLRVGPDRRLYIGVGAPCNVPTPTDMSCLDPAISPYFATIISMNLDGSDLRIVARGVRNTVGMTWHPITNQLYFTDNGRDGLGNDFPSDELNVVTREGEHFGFPYCHGNNHPDPELNPAGNCTLYTPSVYELGPHVAALGLRFYQGEMFPSAEYNNSILIAQHGSWNRTPPLGYRLISLRLPDNTMNSLKDASYTGVVEMLKQDITCLTGADCSSGVCSNGYCTGVGRPVDLEILADGSILMTDDANGVLYRITYTYPHSQLAVYLVAGILGGLALGAAIFGIVVLVRWVKMNKSRRNSVLPTTNIIHLPVNYDSARDSPIYVPRPAKVVVQNEPMQSLE